MKNMIKLNFGKKISNKDSCFIIAEAGVNHNGSLSLGKKLIDIAVEAGADAVKFQTFTADEIILKHAPKAKYHIETTGSNKDLSWHKLLKSQEISFEMHKKLISYCKKKKIIFISTPYDKKSADLLEKLNVEIYKIASTDTNNYQLIEHIAKKGKPVILSTAMSDTKEVFQAYKILKKYLKDQFAIMQCTGSYPAPLSDANLNVIEQYKNQFKCLVGYSDHVMGDKAAIAASALGISCYEKHITTNKKLSGPDHRASMEKDEFINLVKTIKDIKTCLGTGKKIVMECEKQNIKKLRKYIVSNKIIKKGDKLTQDSITSKRTGGIGISTSFYKKVLNKKALKNISINKPITFSMISK